MSALRSAAESTLNSTRLVGVAAVVAVVEIALRVLLAFAVSPLLVVALPPVVAVVAFGVVVPESSVTDDSRPRYRERLRGRGRTLAVTAVRCHAAALALGVAAFLLLDTAVRAGLYRAGFGHRLGPAVQLLAPLVGVGVGTFLAWGLLAPAGAASSASPSRTATRTLVTAAESPRDAAVAVAVHLLAAVLLAVPGVVGLAYVRGPFVPHLVVGVAASLTAVVATFALAFLAAFHATDAPEMEGRSWRPSVRAALVVGLLVALVVGSGAVRVTERRPVDVEAKPLPSDPDARYATAFENTERASHGHRVTVLGGGDEPFVVERRIDRADRQYRQFTAGSALGPDVYADAGVGAPPRRGADAFALGGRTADGRPVRALPDYFRWERGYEWDGGGLRPPAPVDGWRVVDETDRRVTLELTDPVAVFAAGQRRRPDAVRNVSAARIRAVVDTRRRTLERVEYRLNATVVVEGSEGRVDGHVVHEFAVGIDVKRPAALGPRTPGEWAWKLFAY